MSEPELQGQPEAVARLSPAQCSAVPEPTLQEIRDIVLAEYKYWRAVTQPEVEWFAAGCMAASANILCAIDGHRAAWHPQLKPNDQAEAPEN